MGGSGVPQLLLQAKATVNARDVQQSTPLFAAAANGDVSMLRALIEADADGKARDSSGQTALFGAARQASLEVVKMLVLQAFVNPAEKDDKGLSADRVAKRARPSAQAGVADYLAKVVRGSNNSANLPRRKYQLAFVDPADETGNTFFVPGRDEYDACLKQTHELLPWLRSPQIEPSL